MKQFIVLTAVTGQLVAIRPSSIEYIHESDYEYLPESDYEGPVILVKTDAGKWYISPEKHSVHSIASEIEE